MCEKCQKNKGGYFGEARSSEWGAREKTSVEKFDMSAALSMYIMTTNTIIDTFSTYMYPLMLPAVIFNAFGSFSTITQCIFEPITLSESSPSVPSAQASLS